MKKRFVTVLLACSLAGGLFAQQPWFKDKDLTLTGAYYYPEHWDESQWERDFKQMHDLGFEFTHFAEFAWAQLEPEEGKYDFAWLDKAVALAAKYDLKVIMCTSTATPPVWLSRKYPEILIKNEMVPCLITEHVNMLLLLLPFIENWLINDREVSSALWK